MQPVIRRPLAQVVRPRQLAAVVLGVACLFLVVAWGWCRYWEYNLGRGSLRIGRFELAHEGPGYDVVLIVEKSSSRAAQRAPSIFYLAGFGLSDTEKFIRVVVPFWFAFVLIGAYPIQHFIRRHFVARTVAYRTARGCCSACGYDLRGAVSRRCPECGSSTSRNSAVKQKLELVVFCDRVLFFTALLLLFQFLALVLGRILILPYPWPITGSCLGDILSRVESCVVLTAAAGLSCGSVSVVLFRDPRRRLPYDELCWGAGVLLMLWVVIGMRASLVGWRVSPFVLSVMALVWCGVRRRSGRVANRRDRE
jgi:hypothetical protein